MKTICKYLFLIMAVCMTVNITSCSKDDDEVGNTNDLIGTWEAISSNGYEKENGTITDQWNTLEDEVRLVLEENGVYTQYYKYNGKWYTEESGKWSKSGNKLYVTDSDNDTYALTISQLTESRLTLVDQGSEREDGDLYEWYEEITFKKIN